jgi:hypothetical protein
MPLLKRFILKKFYDIFKLISENVIDQNPAQGPTLAQTILARSGLGVKPGRVLR